MGKMNGFSERVTLAMRTNRHKRNVYAALSLLVTFVEVFGSFAAAFFTATESYEAAGACSLGVGAIVSVDAALAIRERAAHFHALYYALNIIHDRMDRERRGYVAHPYEAEYEAIIQETPIDLVMSASELCVRAPVHVVATP
tara:strand:- start:901 stop:1326 length:426 start_codon:yes stop_codon:yes gene_type:complete